MIRGSNNGKGSQFTIHAGHLPVAFANSALVHNPLEAELLAFYRVGLQLVLQQPSTPPGSTLEGDAASLLLLTPIKL